MHRWLPRTDLMLDRIPSVSQRAIVPYLWLVILLLVLHGAFTALAILPTGDADGLAVLQRTAMLWRIPVAYLALAIAWLAAGAAIVALIDSQPVRHRPYLIAGALVPPILLVRQAMAIAADRRRRRSASAYGWALRFAGLAGLGALASPLVAEAAGFAAANLAIALVLYTIRSIRPALRWPRRGMIASTILFEVGMAIALVAAAVGLTYLLAVGGALATIGALALYRSLSQLAAARRTVGARTVDAPVRRLTWRPARSTR
jgi:hypothetical protein